MTQNSKFTYLGFKKSDGMRSVGYGWIVFAFVMLFNPNVHLIDILPDFIGYFILAKAIEKAADAAPYFEEARKGFARLGYISLLKIPALMIIAFVRSGNMQDNDIVTLMALIFATLEITCLISAIKNIFDALSYLGERGNVPSLVKSYSLVSTDSLRSLTFTFAILKCILYTLPEFLKLTKSVELSSNMAVVTGSRYYSLALVSALLIGFVFGVVWLCRIIIYTAKIKNEGKFYASISDIATVNSFEEYEKKVYYRFVNRAFRYLIFAAVFSLDISFSNYDDINFLPNFISGIFLTLGIISLLRCTHSKILLIVTAAVSHIYIVISVVRYVFEVEFLDKFGYDSLFQRYSITANRAYAKVQISAMLEMIFYAAMLVIFYIAMRKYTNTKLGKWRDDSNPNIKSRYYHEINVRTTALMIIGLISGLTSCANVFIQGTTQIIFTDPHDVTKPTLFVSSLPWFGFVVTASCLLYAFYSFYYFNFIKEEERV